MLEGKRIVERAAKNPSQKMVVAWIIDVYTNVSNRTGRNAWQKNGFECVYTVI